MRKTQMRSYIITPEQTAPLALKITKSGHQARKIKRRFQFTITSHYALNDRKGKMVAIPSTALRNAQTQFDQNKTNTEKVRTGNLATWEVRSVKKQERRKEVRAER